jgi:hypothetical protein
MQVKDHVLLPWATELDTVDAEFKVILTEARMRDIVSLIPDEWLTDDSHTESAQELRDVYFKFLVSRISASEIFVKEAQNVRETRF